MTTTAGRDSRRLNEALWLVLRRYGRQVTRRPWIAVPALVLPGHRRRARLLRAAARRGPAPRRGRAQRCAHARHVDAVRADVHGPVARRRGRVARRRGAHRTRGDPRHRGAQYRGDGRAVGEGPRVLPRQLRRLAHQTHARLRAPLRGRVRRARVPGDREDPAARVRHGGVVALLAAADPGAARDAVDHRRARGAAHPAPAAARGRPRSRVERAGRTRGRFHRQCGARPGVRPRARRGGDSRRQRARVRQENAPVVGLPELPRQHDHRADVRAHEYAGPDRRAAHQSRHGLQPGDRVPDVQLLRDGHTRDVGVQPGLSQPRGRADRCRAVRRSAAGSADGPGCRLAGAVRAARPRRRDA